MGPVHFSKRVGVYCGSVCCASGTIALAVIYAAASLALSLTARLYLRAFYNAAHVAGLGFFIGCFVLSHHSFKLHKCLNIKAKTLCSVQIVINLWAFLASLAMGVAYTLLIITTVDLDWDFVAAAIFSWLNMVWMLYLLVLTGMGSRGDWFSSYDIGGSRAHKYQTSNGHEMKSMDNGASNGDAMNDVDVTSSSGGCCARCCRGLWSVIFGFFFLLFTVIFAVVIVLSAYNPAATVSDLWGEFRSDLPYMYTVEVPGHRPLALFMRCRGNGSETIVYENGWGGLAYAQWDVMPKYLENKYTVCVHDRRGYGWSESFEYDHLDINIKEGQWAKTNTEFFKALVIKANISTPFYYMGHSYGGIHAGFMGALYPQMVKGLILLDSAKFGATDPITDFLEVIVNFQPLGVHRLPFDLGIWDPKTFLEGQFLFSNISEETMQRLMANVKSGLYLASFMREKDLLFGNYAANQLRSVLAGSRAVTVPVFVIDAGDTNPWFGNSTSKYFSKVFYARVPGSNHLSLVYGANYSHITADLVDAFIRMEQKQITLSQFDTLKFNLTRG